MKKDHVLKGPSAFEGGQSSIIEIKVTVSWNQSIDIGAKLFVRFDMQLVGKLGWIWVLMEKVIVCSLNFPSLSRTKFRCVTRVHWSGWTSD